MRILDNVIEDCPEDAIDVTGARDLVYRGNTMARSKLVQIKAGFDFFDDIAIDGCAEHEDCAVGDPLLDDDLRPGDGSPAVDAAGDLALCLDADGAERDESPDVGAVQARQ